PTMFVVSMRLGDPPSIEPLEALVRRFPWMRFKLDATSDWTDELASALATTGRVETIDFKGAYSGTPVDQPPDRLLYRRIVETFPHAWLEDPGQSSETDEIIAPFMDRVTWDAPLHSVDDIRNLRHKPRIINVKPSRFGSVRMLCDVYDHCAHEGIRAYGGGQFELGPGRGQIQYLAALFHPDGPNDVAPAGFNKPEPPAGLPKSPLPPPNASHGFRREERMR
ncbi:MAG: hypothetical protein OEQ13_08000, partial [Acidobacteriota bacterium]|nr:hypothetical protein [Acidobacteriota bacterium]